MTATEPEPATSQFQPRPFQFSLRTMLLVFVVLASSLGVFGGWGVVVFALVVGLAIFLQQVESLGSLVWLALVVLFLMCLGLLPAVESSRGSSRRSICGNNLKQIALALYSYTKRMVATPPAYIADSSGKPMHSWRVLILPYME